MKNKQQTGVDFVIDYVKQHISKDVEKIKISSLLIILSKAKAIEKKKTLEFAENAIRRVLDEDIHNPNSNLEQYYDETYGK